MPTLAISARTPRSRSVTTCRSGAARRLSRSVRGVWVPRLVTALAAAAVAAAVALGIAQSVTQHRLNQAQAHVQSVAAVLAAPDARLTSQASTAGGTVTVVSSQSRTP